ncbi:MAG: hypothetical protein IKM20_03245 [Erysipelotrichales bacterium]|nr:hypothetical protein [Erysipelotrichales bacterium]
MKKYLVVVNEYEEFTSADATLHEWEHNEIYEHGKKIFYIVSAENGNEARYQLIHKLIPAWNDEFTTETLWHINDCLLDHYEHMDKVFLGDLFSAITENTNANGKIQTPERFSELFSDEIKLALYQDLMLTTYHVYEYSEL